jgi:hypothetical protein
MCETAFTKIIQQALIDMALVQCSEEEFEAGLEQAIREIQLVLTRGREAKRFRPNPGGNE